MHKDFKELYEFHNNIKNTMWKTELYNAIWEVLERPHTEDLDITLIKDLVRVGTSNIFSIFANVYSCFAKVPVNFPSSKYVQAWKCLLDHDLLNKETYAAVAALDLNQIDKALTHLKNHFAIDSSATNRQILSIISNTTYLRTHTIYNNFSTVASTDSNVARVYGI